MRSRNLYLLKSAIKLSLFVVAGIFFAAPQQTSAAINPVLEIIQSAKPQSVLAQSRLWNVEGNKSTFTDAQHFFSQNENTASQKISLAADIHWFRLRITQNYKAKEQLFLAVPFTDHVYLYTSTDNGKTYKLKKSGDLVPLYKRDVQNGQMVFIDFEVFKGQFTDVYLKLESRTNISQQFKKMALNSIRIYTKAAYTDRFENERIYQALFYGALAIMMLYNLILSISLASRSYAFYVLFLLLISIFLASSSGYLFELVLPAYPRLDLYIRFNSTPLLLLSYLVFSEQYLRIRSNVPKAHKVWLGLIVLFCLLAVLMLFSFWKTGRTLTIISAVISFIYVLVMAFYINKKGFAPARYFIIANIFLVAGGILFALSRFNLVVHSTLIQYSLQIAILLQVALLSLGLADRFNLFRKNLAAQVLENEKLKLRSEQEQKQLIEIKNKELQTVNTELATFIYRTSHDIRGPLARLLGLCNIGLIDVEDINALDYLQKIQLTAQNLDVILRRLTTMQEITQAEYTEEDIDFEAIIHEIQQQLSAYNMQVDLHLQENLRYRSDRHLIKFILNNLIENAFKFSSKNPAEKPFVKADIQAVNDKLIITVTDNGTGIKPDEAEYIFQMFSTVGTKYENTGMGLYMVKKVLDKMGGTIQLENRDDSLTQFTVSLPLVQ